MRALDPAAVFALILLIGGTAGFLFDRFAGPSWLGQQFAGRRGIVTSMLVGIAGAFIGFHLSLIGRMVGMEGFALLIGAAAGAGITLLLWRMIR
jgi:uncharacterized membrane protein YeaQ/YmgE (transglycosylase-associated protein family)